MWLVMLLRLKACRVSSMSCGLSSTSRISTARSTLAMGSSQSEVECRAPVDGRLGPDPPSVPVHDALDDAQPQPSPVILLGPVQTLEDPKELASVLHVEPHAVVTHIVHVLGLRPRRRLRHFLHPARRRGGGARDRSQLVAYVYRGLGPVPGELQRVGEQVDKDLLEQRWISLAVRQLRDLDGHRPPVELRAEIGQGLTGDVGGGHPLPFQGLSTQSRKREEVVDQTPHLHGILADHLRSEEHTSELQSLAYLVCRLLL